MATAGIAAQGISAAIVYTAIDKISDMIVTADNAMRSNIDREINAALNSTKSRPDAALVGYREKYESARGAVSGANLDGENPEIDELPMFLENVMGSFFDDYMAKMDLLFPGMSAAGQSAETFVRTALASATGMSYSELVDGTPAETAFLMARRQAFAQEREALDTAAAAGHRFAHGQVMDALARMHGSSISAATDALVQSHAKRLEQERSEKIRLARTALDTGMNRLKKIHEQVAESFKLKLRARGMWINDQNQVVDSVNGVIALNEKFDANVTGLIRKAASRRFGLDFDAAAAADRDDFLGKIKMANANEVVDLFGNMVTTLMNQVSTKGGYNGTETDRTDWDSILA
ncbi:hypothetical protein [Acidovorax sp. RAC01]|uniref:hypothetical protein n=1 Tax=Acidovorax sp. RAC01 TaxID=1842533 RepID=UPI00083E8C79|nr:hypothetical protein [Acidovorax sp. RAC01]AOG21871.1 hypothetical protein BSY15_3810 [Acidovorax sp. RAC01]AOG25355.1 hypothetical protein BSY15_3732 [Acidovorax sp. RAC01]